MIKLTDKIVAKAIIDHKNDLINNRKNTLDRITGGSIVEELKRLVKKNYPDSKDIEKTIGELPGNIYSEKYRNPTDGMTWDLIIVYINLLRGTTDEKANKGQD